jgi:Type II/IV secretion system protein
MAIIIASTIPVGSQLFIHTMEMSAWSARAPLIGRLDRSLLSFLRMFLFDTSSTLPYFKAFATFLRVKTQPMANSPKSLSIADACLRPYMTPTQDLTVYWEVGEEPNCLSQHFSAHPFAQSAVEESVTLVGAFDDHRTNAEGRSCICSCFSEAFLSATFRCKYAPLCSRQRDDREWRCSADLGTTKALVETRLIVDALFDSFDYRLTPSGTPIGPFRPKGLVVFSAATNSAKSSVAQAFCLEAIRRTLLDAGARRKRRPHLVTFEDPIEGWTIGKRSTKDHSFDKAPLKGPADAVKFGFCLTARERGKDVANLALALNHARRQTPTCFYIGEVRDIDEWKECIDFAGSGHLVVATTHASSLCETVARILRAVNATLPTDRRNVGAQLQACIHLQLESLSSGRGIVLPALWIRKGAALNSLVADGLSSVVPNGDYVLSRHQFLMDRLITQLHSPSSQVRADIDHASQRALHLDIEELQRQ